jgi:hypothetical protein
MCVDVIFIMLYSVVVEVVIIYVSAGIVDVNLVKTVWEIVRNVLCGPGTSPQTGR